MKKTNDDIRTSFTFPIEGCNGKIVQTNICDFLTTGIAPSWEQAKAQVEKYGVSSLGTVGYFINPEGMITCSSRFTHYLNTQQS